MRGASRSLVLVLVACLAALSTAARAEPPEPEEVDRKRGLVHFREHCAGCHALSRRWGAQMGPNLERIGVEAGSRRPGTSGLEYLVESLLDPDAFRAPGASGSMPAGAAASLEDDELRDLLALLATTGGQEATPELLEEIARFELPERRVVAPPPPPSDLSALQRGEAIFRGKGACASCHALAVEPGADWRAPTLQKVGVLGGEALRRAIETPSADIHPGYASVVATGPGGETRSGRLARQTPTDAVVLGVDDTGRRRGWALPTTGPDAWTLAVSDRSAMPAMPLSPDELDDLVAFLLAVR